MKEMMLLRMMMVIVVAAMVARAPRAFFSYFPVVLSTPRLDKFTVSLSLPFVAICCPSHLNGFWF